MLNTIVRMRLPSGEEVDIVDWSDKPLYSSFDVANGFDREELVFFQYVESDPVPFAANPGGAPGVARTATRIDTNIASQGAMADTEEMLIYAIKPEVFVFTVDPVNDFSTRSILNAGAGGSVPTGMPLPRSTTLGVFNQRLVLQFITEDKDYTEAGFGYYNTGFGPFSGQQVIPAGAGTPIDQATAGLPSQEAVRSFFVPIHLGVQSKYNITLINPDPAGQVFFFFPDEEDRGEVDDVMATIRLNMDGLYKRPTA